MPTLPLGKITVTPSAAQALKAASVTTATLLSNHRSGDWSSVNPADAKAYAEAYKNGQLVISTYSLSDDQTVLVVTNADRSETRVFTEADKAQYEVNLEEGYAQWAQVYDQQANALIAVEEKLTEPILQSLTFNYVLDLGTGTGRYALRLAQNGARVVALDQSEAMLTVARERAAKAGINLFFDQHDLEEELPIGDDTFDLVISALTLSHVEDLGLVASEAYRVLKPGGHFLITDFHPRIIDEGWRAQFTSAGITYLLPTASHTRESYTDALTEAGFTITTLQEALVRHAPAGLLPAELVERDGYVPFCLVVLAEKSATVKPNRSD